MPVLRSGCLGTKKRRLTGRLLDYKRYLDSYFESTGICLLIDSSSEISGPVLITPVMA